MIALENFKFELVDDPIKTEQTLYGQLKDKELGIEYVGLPIAYLINTIGLNETQKIIDSINYNQPERKFFICQHIFVNLLNFGNNLVFTPHTVNSDNYHFIPHFNPIFSNPPGRVPIKDRKLEYSFIGDFNTNEIRNRLSALNSKSTPIIPTGQWFFSKDKNERETLLGSYTETLKYSKFSLCPMGTGPSTLRLFESMSVGSIPIIFNDLKIEPGIKKLIRSIKIDDFIKDPNIIESSESDIESDSMKLYEIYWETLSNENLYKSVLKVIKEYGY